MLPTLADPTSLPLPHGCCFLGQMPGGPGDSPDSAGAEGEEGHGARSLRRPLQRSGVSAQVRTLTYKNYLLARRNWKSTAAQVLARS